MRKLTPTELRLFGKVGYPRISPTNEMEWWVSNSDYTSKIAVGENTDSRLERSIRSFTPIEE